PKVHLLRLSESSAVGSTVRRIWARALAAWHPAGENFRSSRRLMAAASQDEASRVALEAWLVTDVGVVREHNEDAAYMEPSNGFFIVADGMGGHAAGEVASAMAVDTVRKTLENARKEIDTFKRAPSDAGRRSIVQLLQNAVLS